MILNELGKRAVLDPAAATRTVKDLAVYADGTSGNDASSGLSASTPKKTRQAAFDLVPFLISTGHFVVVHLSGSFTDGDGATLERHVMEGGMLLVDGGDSVTIVDDNTGSNYDATSASTASIVDSGATWTANAYIGYWVEILTGPAAGQTRQIFRNTTNAITPTRVWSVSPGIGATFRIVKGATEINYSGSAADETRVANTGLGDLIVQRIRLLGTKPTLIASNSPGPVILGSGIISDAASPIALHAYNNGDVTLGFFTYNPTTGALEDAITDPYLGISQRNTSSKVVFHACQIARAQGMTARRIDTICCNDFVCRAGGPRLVSPGSQSGPLWRMDNVGKGTGTLGVAGEYTWATTTGYFNVEISGDGSDTGVAVLAVDCRLRLQIGDIDNAGSHGIELRHSLLEMPSLAVSGSGNTGAGVYAHTGSEVVIKDGTPPTITGTVGDLSFDGTTEASTWANIDAGTPVNSAAEVSMAKEQ